MKRQDRISKWTVLWSGVVVSIILGILYVWSIISQGLKSELNWTDTQASLPYTLFSVFLTLGFLISGLIQDRIGPRKCITVCAIMMGAGLVLCGIFTTPWAVALGFGAVCGGGVGFGNAASLAPALKWFPDSKKGLISGVVVSGIAFSAVIYSPVSTVMIPALGISNSFLIFGALSFIVMMAMSFNMYNPPSGYNKNSGDKSKAKKAPARKKAAQMSLNANVPTKEMLKTGDFYIMFVIFAFSAASGLMIIAKAALIAGSQANLGGYAFILVIVLNLFNACGRVLGGQISDRLGRTNTLKLILAVQAVNMALFTFYTNPAVLVIGMMVQGFCYGSFFSVMPSLTADLFGLKNFGSNYGSLYIAWGIGGIIGPMSAGAVFDATQSYGTAYIIACALSVISLALVFLLHIRMAKSAKSKAKSR